MAHLDVVPANNNTVWTPHIEKPLSSFKSTPLNNGFKTLTEKIGNALFYFWDFFRYGIPQRIRKIVAIVTFDLFYERDITVTECLNTGSLKSNSEYNNVLLSNFMDSANLSAEVIIGKDQMESVKKELAAGNRSKYLGFKMLHIQFNMLKHSVPLAFKLIHFINAYGTDNITKMGMIPHRGQLDVFIKLTGEPKKHPFKGDEPFLNAPEGADETTYWKELKNEIIHEFPNVLTKEICTKLTDEVQEIQNHLTE